jgi:putative membrane protein
MDGLVGWALAGCCAGIVTGMTPGIHTNTIALISITVITLGGIHLAVFIIAMALVHSFVDFIPSMIVGIPDPDTIVAILPGHQLFHQGTAVHGIFLTVVGGITAGIISLLFLPIIGLFVHRVQNGLPFIIPPLLVLVLGSMLWHTRSNKWGVRIIGGSGLLGMLVLNSTFTIPNPLFPLITGLFGVSGIIHSAQFPFQTIPQSTHTTPIPISEIEKATAVSSVGGMLVSMLPSLGAGQAAFLIQRLMGTISPPTYLMIVGGINTATMLVSVAVWFTIQSTRTGTAVAISTLISPSFENYALLTSTMLIALGVGGIATLILARTIIPHIHTIPFRILNVVIVLFITGIAFMLSGGVGILILVTATALGTVCVFTGVKRTHCMAVLMIPTLVFYVTQYYI